MCSSIVILPLYWLDAIAVALVAGRAVIHALSRTAAGRADFVFVVFDFGLIVVKQALDARANACAAVLWALLFYLAHDAFAFM
jgi:hypothetical protein